MKTWLVCALLLILIITTACASNPTPVSRLRQETRTMPAGHYSLVFIPESASTTLIPVTGDEGPRWDFFNACNGRVDKIHPRFGRSLFYPCRNK